MILYIEHPKDSIKKSLLKLIKSINPKVLLKVFMWLSCVKREMKQADLESPIEIADVLCPNITIKS